MLPTPSTSHCNYSHIYEPSEDSYLLLDTLALPLEILFLSARFPPATHTPVVLEVGTGSGVVLAFATKNASKIFGRPDIASIGTDVNNFACTAARQTVGDGGVDVLQGDLATPLRKGVVDVLIFNPPYVPTESLPIPPKAEQSGEWERDSHLLALSYAGGIDGMETTDRLLTELPHILSDRGVAYILLCAQNKPEAVVSSIRAWEGDENWQAERVSSSGKQAGWEKLCVIRIWRS
ncbi:related to methyltransferase S. pombe [Ramularia collo-cygni]|uniref:Related to methyltransferase S. pombe n=1 Tax=Ramularia collo-cygni TaxID=112498 RepID=A0A2D3VJ52_9PEZI|nr:related to methyltransferase S. pombe [Ramularia collo-cygni]CZT23309.1 related to methyltransferase S. pombe [Ramularia collo-cygni]